MRLTAGLYTGTPTPQVTHRGRSLKDVRHLEGHAWALLTLLLRNTLLCALHSAAGHAYAACLLLPMPVCCWTGACTRCGPLHGEWHVGCCSCGAAK